MDINCAEIDDHLDRWRTMIDSNDEPDHLKAYFRAQILISSGNYIDAVKILIEAFGVMNHLKDQYSWQGIYYSVGGLLATSLDYIGMVDKAGEIFDEIIGSNPNGCHVCDYAVYLHRRRKDYDKAQSFYLKALQQFPDSSFTHLKYAGFLRHARKDGKSAEVHYKLSCEKNPQNSEALGGYASYLHASNTSIDGAALYYEKAIKVDPTHINNLCNFGLFLSEEKHDYDRAEKLYK